MLRLEPAHRIEGDLQRDVDGRRERDHRQAGNQRQLEIEPLLDDEDGRELAEHGEPAQPQDRVQPDMRARFAKIGGGVVGHLRAILPFGP